MTWGDVGAIFAVLVVGSLVAGLISAWWDQRKWERKKREVMPMEINGGGEEQNL